MLESNHARSAVLPTRSWLVLVKAAAAQRKELIDVDAVHLVERPVEVGFHLVGWHPTGTDRIIGKLLHQQ